VGHPQRPVAVVEDNGNASPCPGWRARGFCGSARYTSGLKSAGSRDGARRSTDARGGGAHRAGGSALKAFTLSRIAAIGSSKACTSKDEGPAEGDDAEAGRRLWSAEAARHRDYPRTRSLFFAPMAGVGGNDNEGLPPAGPDPSQPDPEETVRSA